MYISLLQKLPLVIIGVLFLCAVITIYVRSKNVTHTEFFKLFKSIRLLTVWAVIFVFLMNSSSTPFRALKRAY